LSLPTPEKIGTLQRKLYAKAKAEPAIRFYLLYDKIHRADILAHAYALAKANKSAPGVDGVTFKAIESAGLEGWLAGLAEELRGRRYRPQPVRRVLIPKPGGGERPRPCGAWLRHDASRPSRIGLCRRPPSWCWSRCPHGARQPATLGRSARPAQRDAVGYFGYGPLKRAYSEVNWYVANRVRHFLRRRHKVRSRASRQFSTEQV
jgi:hypothetical protein